MTTLSGENFKPMRGIRTLTIFAATFAWVFEPRPPRGIPIMPFVDQADVLSWFKQCLEEERDGGLEILSPDELDDERLSRRYLDGAAHALNECHHDEKRHIDVAAPCEQPQRGGLEQEHALRDAHDAHAVAALHERAGVHREEQDRQLEQEPLKTELVHRWIAEKGTGATARGRCRARERPGRQPGR